MDLVLCRNVVIYFDEAGRRATLDNLHRALRPGSYLLLGLSEAMARISGAFRTCPPERSDRVSSPTPHHGLRAGRRERLKGQLLAERV